MQELLAPWTERKKASCGTIFGPLGTSTATWKFLFHNIHIEREL
jgi:hypothetical protein